MNKRNNRAFVRFVSLVLSLVIVTAVATLLTVKSVKQANCRVETVANVVDREPRCAGRDSLISFCTYQYTVGETNYRFTVEDRSHSGDPMSIRYNSDRPGDYVVERDAILLYALSCLGWALLIVLICKVIKIYLLS